MSIECANKIITPSCYNCANYKYDNIKYVRRMYKRR